MKGKIFVFKNLSKHYIPNALTHKDLPLSDEIHGVYQMTPPELLHTSGSGLIMYMLSSLESVFQSGRSGMAQGVCWTNYTRKFLLKYKGKVREIFLMGL